MSTIAKRLKLLRDKKGLTQKEVSSLTGIVRATLANWEIGRTEPDLGALKLLAEFYETSTDYILGLTDDPTPPQPKKQEKLNFEEYVLSAPALGEALIRIAELDDEYSMDEPTFADLSQKAFKKFGLSKAKGSDRAAGGIKMPGTGALDD